MQLFEGIKLGFEGKRLDVFLAGEFSDFSRSKLQKLVKDGVFRVNKAKAKAGYVLKVSDVVGADLDKVVAPSFKEEPFELKVVIDDADFMVVEKPAGMVVHPGEGDKYLTGTVANKVRGMVTGFDPDDERPGIVHRLDKDTSGLLIVAKNPAAKEYFSELFKERKVEKKYMVLVEKVFDEKAGVIEAPIARSSANRKKMVINSDGGRYAKSIYRVKEEFELEDGICVSLVEVEIETGRTHQIRVHLSAIGHDVVGDEVYGNKTINGLFARKYGLKRQFLHAGELAFVAPGAKKITRLVCDLPDDLNDVLRNLRKSCTTSSPSSLPSRRTK